MEEYLLDAEEVPRQKLYDADRGKRFLNFIIDYIGYLISYYALAFIAGIILGLSGLYSDELVDELGIWFTLIALIWMVLYYWLMEWLLKGRTIGKFLTQTRAVTKDDTFLTPGQALGRALGRLIPFDAFSYLFGERGFHDMVSNTRVVDWPKDWK
jgi:uncharacterized RDD family membrane protein YckC